MSASPEPNLTSAKLDTQTVAGQAAGRGVAAAAADVYVAPFKHVRDLSLARTDQGVDFAGHGRIDAIGDCVITDVAQVAQNNLGGGGPFLIYKLTDPAGDHHGSYIFIAEQHSPTHGVGAKVKKGEQISTMNGHIEIGFAAGPKGPWNPIDPYNGRADGTQTEGGKRFARFLRSLGQTTQQDPGPGSGASTTVDTGGGGGSGGSDVDVAATARAAALSTFIQLPGIFNTFESRALAGQKSLMNDQPLLPFVEQLAQASLRNFQSMPNGNFFAFFPDYFGGLNHRTPYWEIEDIEIIDGTIDLSDDALATHVYMTGDITGFDGAITIGDKVYSSGVVTIFNAFAADFISGINDGATNDTNTPSSDPSAVANNLAKEVNMLSNKENAITFLQKYGARPYQEDAPMVRSPFFELFLSYQKFMLMWSQQFLTTFTFTFMPELFPGGIVAFREHGIQCYIAEVTHSFDFETGFTTQANLMAPAALDGATRKNVHEGMIRAFTLGPDDIPYDPFEAAREKRDAKKHGRA
jgi:hypothetical protein